MKVCGNPASTKAAGTTFLSAFAHFGSLCHSLVILEVFPSTSKKIMTLCRLRRCLAFFSNAVFLIKGCTFFFFLRQNVVAGLVDYIQQSANVTITCSKTKKFVSLASLQHVLWWRSGSEFAISAGPCLYRQFKQDCPPCDNKTNTGLQLGVTWDDWKLN